MNTVLPIPLTLLHLQGLAVDFTGNLFIIDSGNNKIRMTTRAIFSGSTVSSYMISTIAGTGVMGTSGDLCNDRYCQYTLSLSNSMPRYTINAPGDGGPASSAQIAPTSLGIALDIQGNIYFAEAYGIHRVRMITRKTWNIRTIVGSSTGVSGVLGDGGLAIKALLSTPGSLAIDNNMNLFIAEVGSGRIRMVNNNTNIITTIAGNTDSYSSPNGGYSLPATSANLLGMVTETSGLAVDFGHVYVVDYTDNKVFVVNRFTGILMAYAGTGDPPSLS